MAETKSKSFKVKFKPVYNFQSIEIEIEVDKVQDIIDFVEYDYPDILTSLRDSTDKVVPANANQKVVNKVSRPTPSTRFVPPTERQIEIMEQYGIEYDDFTTRDEARALIKKNIENQ